MRRPVLVPTPGRDHLVVAPERAVEEQKSAPAEPLEQAPASARRSPAHRRARPPRPRDAPPSLRRLRSRSPDRRPRDRAAPCRAPRTGSSASPASVDRRARPQPRRRSTTPSGQSTPKTGLSAKDGMDRGRWRRAGRAGARAGSASPATWSTSALGEDDGGDRAAAQADPRVQRPALRTICCAQVGRGVEQDPALAVGR